MKGGSYDYKVLGFSRKFKNNDAGPPTDVKQAFAKFANGGDYMSADQLLQFFVEHQGQVGCTVHDAEMIIENVLHKHRDQKSAKDKTDAVQGLTLNEFFHFLFFDDHNVPMISKVSHDMDLPLSHYFIYTSHNSYLTGNQLSSDCSDAPIKMALRRGVRVIELDLWPNSAKDDVNVLHGRTLTSPVSLIKCLRSIKEYAFEKSPYPVIITLEDHLTPELQAKVAEMLLVIFGEMLYYPEESSLTEFPSPNSLMKRIIISTKPPKEYLESDQDDEEQENDSSAPEFKCPSTRQSSEQKSSQQGAHEYNGMQSSQPGAPEYKRLITIHARKPKDGLKEAFKGQNENVQRLSLSEPELEKAAVSHGTDLVRFTQWNIARIYPKGTRFNSSNYNPHIGWMHGAQMVAFNMQGYGKYLHLMHGMFRTNGGCGYVRKPAFLIERGPNNEVFDPKEIFPVKRTLKVKVLMGDGWSSDFSQTHFDTYSPPDFYTKVHIAGVPADVLKKRTKTVEDNWIPVWEEEFEFPLRIPELALLRIEVRDYDRSEKDDFGGQTCFPVLEIRPGIRAVPLHDKKGEKLNHVKLLMNFQLV